MTEKNPWLSITEGNVKIAECDVPYFERKGSVEEYAENINLKDRLVHFYRTVVQKYRKKTKRTESHLVFFWFKFGSN